VQVLRWLRKKTEVHKTDSLVKEFVVHEGYKRAYYVHVPASFNPQQATPVLLVFHQERSNARAMSHLTRFHEFSEQYGFLVVYPEGVDTWDDGRRTDARQMNDVGFCFGNIDEFGTQMAHRPDRCLCLWLL